MQAVKVATALNWQMACGCIAAADPIPGSFDPLKYNKSYASEYDKVKQYTTPFVGPFKVGGVWSRHTKLDAWLLLHGCGCVPPPLLASSRKALSHARRCGGSTCHGCPQGPPAGEQPSPPHLTLSPPQPLQALLETNDFLGLSGYGAGYPLKDLSWRDIEIPLQTLAYELKFLGIGLKDLIKNKPVIYVEQVQILVSFGF